MAKFRTLSSIVAIHISIGVDLKRNQGNSRPLQLLLSDCGACGSLYFCLKPFMKTLQHFHREIPRIQDASTAHCYFEIFIARSACAEWLYAYKDHE
jgi:hypothetical protein